MRKGFTLIELLAVLVVLAVLLIIIIPNVDRAVDNSKKESFRLSVEGLYDVIHQDQVELGFETKAMYLYDNHSLTRVVLKSDGTEERTDIKVTGNIPDGVGKAYLNKYGDIEIAVKNKEWCARNSYEDENVYINFNDNCDISRLLTLKEILENSTVTTGPGLYKNGEEYRFRGGCNLKYKEGHGGNKICSDADPVNNYVIIDDQKYRIISMDSQGVRVMTQDDVIVMSFDNGLAYDETNEDCNEEKCPRNNDHNTFCQQTGHDYLGCNVYAVPIGGTFTAGGKTGTVTQNSSVYDYLNINSTEAAVTTLRKIVKNASWNIGAVTRDSNATLSTIKSQEAAYKANFKLGLLNVSDYVAGSLDSDCVIDPLGDIAANFACQRKNWLFNENSSSPWAMNPEVSSGIGDADLVWRIMPQGYLGNMFARDDYGIRPVGYLSSDTQVAGGTGTEADPWVLNP